MSLILPRILVACLVSVAAHLAMPGQDSAQSLVGRAIEAAGGRAQLQRFRALQWQAKAVVHIPGRRITILGTWDIQPPDSSIVATYDSVQGPRTTRRMIVAGSRGWMQRDSQLVAMPNGLLTEERHQFYLYSLLRLLPLETPGVRVSSAAADSAGNAGLLVEAPGRLLVTMYFDRDARVVRLRTTFATDSGPGPAQDIRLEGAVEASGVRWFRKMVIHRDGRPYFEMELTSLKALPGLNDPLLRGVRPRE